MKRVVIAWLILLVCAYFAHAFTASVGSGKISSSAVVVDKPVYLTAVQIRDDGTNQLTVSLYDSDTATSDTSKLIGSYVINAGENIVSGWIWPTPRFCQSGIYVSISGGTGYAIVEYTQH